VLTAKKYGEIKIMLRAIKALGISVVSLTCTFWTFFVNM